MYFLLSGRCLSDNPARFLDSGSITDFDLWWDDGVHFDALFPTPVRAMLEPFNPHHPEMSKAMPEAFMDSVPFFRDDLIAALRDTGVNNLDLYDAEITDPDTGEVHTNYKAVNIIGMHNVADFRRSVADVYDGCAEIDVSFTKLVLDPEKLKNVNLLLFRLEENNGAILVHESVRDSLLRQGFCLAFYDIDKAYI